MEPQIGGIQTFEHPAYTPRIELVPRGDLRNAVPMQTQQRKRGLLRRSAFLQLRKEICFGQLRIADSLPAAAKRTVGFLCLPAPALSALPRHNALLHRAVGNGRERKAAQIGVGAIALYGTQVAHNGKIVIFAGIIPLLLQKRIDQLVILFGEADLPLAQRSKLC